MLIADASGWEETISATRAAGIPSAVSAIFTTGKVSANAAETRATREEQCEYFLHQYYLRLGALGMPVKQDITEFDHCRSKNKCCNDARNTDEKRADELLCLLNKAKQLMQHR